MITRALGTDPDVDVDTFSVDARPGDVFMLCSDGLTTMVDDATILELVERATAATSTRPPRRCRRGEPGRRRGQHHGRPLRDRPGRRRRTEETAALPVVADQPRGRRGHALRGSTACRDRRHAHAQPRRARGDGRDARPRAPRDRRVPDGGDRRLAALVRRARGAGSSGRCRAPYFVGAEPNGQLAVYQGFPWNIAGGVRLYRVRYESPVLAGQLSQSERRKLLGHDLRSYHAALEAIKVFEAEVVP